MPNVAVTGLNAVDTPGPGVPVVRCLTESPHFKGNLIGLAYDALEPGILDSHLLHSAYLLPYPGMGPQSLLERIRFIHEQQRLDAIIPTLDAELLNFIQIQKELSALQIQMALPTEESLLRRSKTNLPQFAEMFGFKTPKTLLVTDPNKLSLTEQDLPVFVKGIFYEAYLAYTMEDLFRYMYKISAKWGYPVLLQEYIEGEEYNAATVGHEGQASGIVCMKKLVLTDKGKGWACVTIKNEGLIEMTRKIVASLRWHGPMEVEVILSKKDQKFYIIELNPRFPAWIYLAKAAGINLPYLSLLLALGGEGEPATDYKTGVVFSNYTTNLITDLTRIQTLFTTGEIHYTANNSI